MAGEVDHERLARRLVDAALVEQYLDVEEIARVLPIEGRADLAAVEIGQRERGHRHGHLEGFLGGRDEVALLGREHGAANDLVRLDHDPRGFVLDEKARGATGIARDGLLHGGADDRSLEPARDAVERRADVLERRLARIDRDVGQVDVDGEPRHVAPEKVDRGAPF